MDDRLNFLRKPSTAGGTAAHLPITASFTNRVSGASGEVALQYWPARGASKAPSYVLLYILGNPGLLNYYIPFLNHLHSLLPDTHAIISTSHIGHSPDLPHPPKALDLPAQLEAKVELVQALRADVDSWAQQDGLDDRPTLALMGHSVGSWFLTEVKKRLASEVDVGYMLFPTVGWIADSWNGRTLWPIFRWPIRSLLPTISPLLRPILPVTTFPPTTLSLLRCSPTIHHCLELSKSEMDVIRDPNLDWFTAEGKLERGKGLYGIWSAGNLDGWVGREGPLVRDCLGGIEGRRVKVLEGVPHAFCLTQEHSELVAETVASWINIGRPIARDGTADESPAQPTGASSVPM